MSEERRLVTVLFADVTGSTALGESLDPEDLRALLARYFAIAREVVTEHGGTLEKFIGDAVMAVFGLPTAHDDDAARAASAALALRDRVRSDPALGDRLPIRLGLATGEVVASMDEGAADFLVTGDTVNVAARLQQGAGDWDIVVSARAARAAGDRFTFGPTLAVEARGKGMPIEAVRLEGMTPDVPHRRTPFLGRDADLDQLDLTTRRALRERRPYLVTITAPAGTGKTRLLEEYLERLTFVEPDVRVLTAQCLPYGQQLTYLPLQTVLRHLLELPESAGLDEIRSAAAAWLEGVGDTRSVRTAELLAATFGAGEGDPIDRAELFAAWRSTIELAARERPLVVVVEDLHWSADSLLDLLEVVLQPRADVALLMIVLARPELLDRRPTWGGGRRNYVSLALEPLGDEAIAGLVEWMLEGPPPEVVDTVVARAEGNPFFAGELARTILDRATDLEDPAAVEAVVATLPDTVHGTVLSRLDLLPVEPRRLLQLGSVFGRSFSVAGVLAVEPDVGDVDGALAGLIEHDLIRPDRGDELTFRHILIREVAYQTMPRAERARLHALAGSWLERLAIGREEEQAELVAFHLLEAATLGLASGIAPDGDLAERAVAWLRRATEAAIAGAAYEEAGRHIRAAIEIAPRDELPELWADLGDIFGGGTFSTDAYATAVRLGRELGRPPDFILGALSGQLMVLGRWGGSVGGEVTPEELARLVGEIRAARAEATDRRAIGYSLVAEAFVPFGAMTGANVALELAASRGSAEQAVAIAEELDDPVLLSAALDAMGSLVLDDDPERALGFVERRASIEERLPVHERCDVHNVLAWTHAALGHLDDVFEAADSILRDLAPNQAVSIALSLSAWKVWSLMMLGRWDEVGPAAERSVRQWEDAGRIAAGYALHGFMAALEVGRARGDDRLARRAEHALLAIAEQFPPGQIFRRLAAFARPDPGELVERVILEWEHYGNRIHLVELALAACVDRRAPIPADGLAGVIKGTRRRGQRLTLAQALRARGVLQGRAEDLREALDLYRDFGATPMIGRVEIELGELIGDPELGASGIGLLEGLGDLDQLGRVRALAR